MNPLSSSALSADWLLESLPAAVFVFGPDGQLRLQNSAAKALAGLQDSPSVSVANLEQALPLFAGNAVGGNEGDPLALPVQNPIWQALEGIALPCAEYVVRRPNSRPIWLECEARPVQSERGEFAGATLSCTNISERKRREQASAARHKVQQFLHDENLAGIIHSTVDGRLRYVNQASVRILGYDSVAELLTIRASQLYWDPHDRDILLRLTAKNPVVYEHEIRFRRKHGGLCWVLASVRLIEQGVDDVGGDLVTSIIDITQRKEWEESLRQSERRFGAFMGNLPGVAFIKDLDGRYIYYNEASQRLFGIPPEHIVGNTDEEIWPSEHATEFRKSDAQVIATGQPVEILETVPHASRSHSWLFNKFPIFEDDQVKAVGGVGIDITERLQLEDELTQVRKMEALGRLAGGVAHDFNNLLTVISGYAQLALEGIGQAPADRLTSYVQEIINSSRRAAGVTNQLLAFSRRQNVQPTVVDVCELLRGMERMLQRLIGEHIDLTVRCSAEPCNVRADLHQLERVVMNLVVNAQDAMPLGGALEIECSRLAGAASPSDSLASPGDEVLLLVRDNGLGMDDETKSRLFEPFFSSKGNGKGTGLGLSTVYGIVKQASGRIEVTTKTGEGSCFRVYLPETRSEATQSSGAVSPPPQSITGTETILLVEDELSVRELSREIMKRLGYNVLVADSGKSALDLWDRHLGKIDLLLTDVIMPQMSGGELAHRLRERNPRLRVLFMSGYTDDMIASHGSLEGATQLLQKPFSALALGRKLRDLLES